MFEAAILKKKNKVDIHYFKIPKILRDDQVLVKIKYAGVCRSQIMEYQGKRGGDKYLPHGFGHEAVGVVRKIGKRVKKIKIGDKVILSWIKGKGLDFGGYSLRDTQNKKINFGPLSTFSSYAIASENRVFLKPLKMSFLEAVLYGCAVPTGAGMVLNQLSHLNSNKKICLIGAGGIGFVALTTLLKKKSKIFVVENNKYKINFLNRLNVKIISNNQELKNYNNYFDYCIETSGSAKMIEKGVKLIRNDGILIFASHPPKKDKIKIDPHDFIKGKRIYGSWGGCCKPDKDIAKIFKFFNYNNSFTKHAKIKKYKLNKITFAFKDVLIGKVHRAIIEF